jgi:hypothetical protein
MRRHSETLRNVCGEGSDAQQLAISREFGKSVDWSLTGKAHVGPGNR